MKFLNKREIKIFLTFFIIYSFFIYWTGWNEQSHFALTRAIVDEGRLEIDSYANQTSDRSYFNGHYYSDKDPVLSFLAVPTYATWKFIYYNFFPPDFKERYIGTNKYLITEVGKNRVPIYDYINPGFFILTSMILVTIFTSSLFSALTVLLIYKISRYFTKNEKHRLILIFTAGLGTLIFPYALVFMEHAIVTFFSFLTFYLLFKAKQEKIKDNKIFIIAGLSAALASCSSITTFITAPIAFAYLIYYRRDKFLYFVAALLFSALFFRIIYNIVISENPFIIPRLYLDLTIWFEIKGYSIEIPNPFITLRLLFYPERGIFFYYPILLLSFIGLYHMYKKFKIESILIISTFFSFLIANSTFWSWWGATCFGPRYLTMTMPFLIIPLLYVFKIKNKKFRFLVFLLIFYSISINFIGLQIPRDEFMELGQFHISKEKEMKLDSFQILTNPIYDYYIPLFLVNGPRSRLLEMIFNSNLNFRDIPGSKRSDIRMFLNLGSNKIDLPLLGILSILITVFLFLIAFKKEIFKEVFLVSISFLILFILFSIILKYDNNWYSSEIENGEIFSWTTSQNASLLILDPLKMHKNLTLSFFVSSYYEPKNIYLFLNGKQIYNEEIFHNNSVNVTLSLNDIFNNLTIHSEENCLYPSTKENFTTDSRCLNLKISHLTIY